MRAIFVRHGGSPCRDLAKLELTEKGMRACTHADALLIALAIAL
jgi:hypothetical protein